MGYLTPLSVALAALGVASLGSASPVCNKADTLLNLLIAAPVESAASSYCSSYLGSPRTTTVKTTVPSTVVEIFTTTLPDVTASADATTTLTEVTTEIVPVTNQPSTVIVAGPTLTETVTTYTVASPPNHKRDILSILGIPSILSFVEGYAASAISSACSCVITVQTTTLTQTATTPTTVSTTVTASPTATVTVTYYQTNTAVITADVTFRVPATPVTTTSTATDVVVVALPGLCNKSGLPENDPESNYLANFNIDQEGCNQACYQDAQCLSSGWYYDSDPDEGDPPSVGVCRYFSQPVAVVASLGYGYYNLNDKACYSPPS